MTQGVMTPYPPSSPSTASLSGAARCWHSKALIFRYFLRYFSSTHRTDLSRFRGTFHSFDPVGFAIFAILGPALAQASVLSNGSCVRFLSLSLLQPVGLWFGVPEAGGGNRAAIHSPSEQAAPCGTDQHQHERSDYDPDQRVLWQWWWWSRRIAHGAP